MTLTLRAFLFGMLCHSISAAICGSVTKTSDPILYLQGSQRCLWIGPTLQSNWTSAMSFCNSQNGYLAHIYNSDDLARIKEWYNTSTVKTQNMYFGLLKDNSNTLTNGSQVHWVTSLTNRVADELKYFYKSFINDWGTTGSPIPTSLVMKSPNMTFKFQNIAAYPICEQASTRMHAFFSNWTGKYLGAPQLITQTIANINAHQCARLCAKKLQCMAFNLMSFGSTTSCELFDITKTDTGIPTLVVNASHSYYKRNFL